MKDPRGPDIHNIYKTFKSHPTHNLWTDLLYGNWFRPWTRVIIRPWYKNVKIRRN